MMEVTPLDYVRNGSWCRSIRVFVVWCSAWSLLGRLLCVLSLSLSYLQGTLVLEVVSGTVSVLQNTNRMAASTANAISETEEGVDLVWHTATQAHGVRPGAARTRRTG